MVTLFGAYVWTMTSNHQQFVLDQGKKIYHTFLAWFDDAEIDFQAEHKAKATKKRSRRWD
jgi:hypothetical protein